MHLSLVKGKGSLLHMLATETQVSRASAYQGPLSLDIYSTVSSECVNNQR